MDTYSTLRQFADSWGLVFLVVVFLAVIAFTFRPGSRKLHQDMASLPLRNDTLPDDENKRPKKPVDASGDGNE